MLSHAWLISNKCLTLLLTKGGEQIPLSVSYLPADFVPGKRQHFELWYHREVFCWYSGHQVTVEVEFSQSRISSQGYSVSLVQSDQAPLNHQFSNIGLAVTMRNDLQSRVGQGLFLLMGNGWIVNRLNKHPE